MTIDYSAGAALTESVTACQQALATLQRLGRAADAEPLLTAAAGEIATVTGATDLDRDHTTEWKITQCARAYSSVMSALAQKLTAAANSAGSQDSDDAARVFGIKGLPGDVASLAISRRDAGDRAAEITDPIERQRLLAQATRTGDDVLAHALVESAITSGDADTTTQFSAAYPDLAPAVERLWAAQNRRMTTVDVGMAWSLAALKPAQLSALQNYEIASAAAGNGNAGSWNV
ncbi:hypothetical protein AWC11_01660 [Mycobacterium interjectum]|nr:hypothetical protein AWC11_01660 [Mycobacterium interjectum]